MSLNAIYLFRDYERSQISLFPSLVANKVDPLVTTFSLHSEFYSPYTRPPNLLDDVLELSLEYSATPSLLALMFAPSPLLWFVADKKPVPIFPTRCHGHLTAVKKVLRSNLFIHLEPESAMMNSTRFFHMHNVKLYDVLQNSTRFKKQLRVKFSWLLCNVLKPTILTNRFELKQKLISSTRRSSRFQISPPNIPIDVKQTFSSLLHHLDFNFSLTDWACVIQYNPVAFSRSQLLLFDGTKDSLCSVLMVYIQPPDI